jgi:hypothetical protein
MKNATAVPSSVSYLKPGDTVLAGYKRRKLWIDSNEFVCFKVGNLKFSTTMEMKSHFGVRNLAALESSVKSQDLGSVTAEFHNIDNDYLWGAYLWQGAFRVGTSADRLVLQNA